LDARHEFHGDSATVAGLAKLPLFARIGGGEIENRRQVTCDK